MSDHEPRTHLDIDAALCGRLLALSAGGSATELVLTDAMKADALGLVHGGFIFGAADYAAMLAVNEPNVCLAAADMRFVRPARVGDTLRFEARVETRDGRKHKVAVVGKNEEGTLVFTGSFACVVPDAHVLAR